MSNINTTTAITYYEAVAANATGACEDEIRVAFGMTEVPEGIDANTEPNAVEIKAVQDLVVERITGQRREPTNSDRAERAELAVLAYDGLDRQWDRDDVDQAHQVIKDLLGDLGHLCDRVGVDLIAAFRASGDNYEAEKSEDEAGHWPLYELVDERCKHCGAIHAGPAPEFCAEAKAEYERTGRQLEALGLGSEFQSMAVRRREAAAALGLDGGSTRGEGR